MTSRREFLKGVGATAASTLWLGKAAAGPYVPQVSQPHFKVIEIMQLGGASHRETTWIETPDAYNPPGRQLDLMWEDVLETSGAYVPPNLDPGLVQLDNNVHVSGAFTPAIGSDLWEKLQVLAVRHHLKPHDPAMALCLTGHPLGRARFAGMAAAVERAHGDPLGPPKAWVLDCGNTRAAHFASTTGLIGSRYRPPVVPIGSDTFLTQLSRAGVDQHAVSDALLHLYDTAYAERLELAPGNPVRSESYQSYSAAIRHIDEHDTILNLLSSGPSLSVSGTISATNYKTRQAIQVATHLLNCGSNYVCILDRGVKGNIDSHGPGITHEEHSEIHNRNLWGILHALRTEMDIGNLDLNQTVVHIHSEFGRYESDTSAGTGHWEEGFPNLVIGGPFTSRQVHGTLDFSSDPRGPAAGGFQGPSGGGYSPTDVRVLMLMLAGVDPFDSGDLFLPLETTTEHPDPQTVLNQFADEFGL